MKDRSLYQLRRLTPWEMDKEKNSTGEDKQSGRVYIEATLNPEEGTFRVTLDDFVLERAPVN